MSVLSSHLLWEKEHASLGMGRAGGGVLPDPWCVISLLLELDLLERKMEAGGASQGPFASLFSAQCALGTCQNYRKN